MDTQNPFHIWQLCLKPKTKTLIQAKNHTKREVNMITTNYPNRDALYAAYTIYRDAMRYTETLCVGSLSIL